jgi:hypothetical protein
LFKIIFYLCGSSFFLRRFMVKKQFLVRRMIAGRFFLKYRNAFWASFINCVRMVLKDAFFEIANVVYEIVF